eukprot:243398-Prorocentrum_minimum.AAC.2
MEKALQRSPPPRRCGSWRRCTRWWGRRGRRRSFCPSGKTAAAANRARRMWGRRMIGRTRRPDARGGAG